jgi:1,2-diacylglycerol 3-alpha-glucosyltransferase
MSIKPLAVIFHRLGPYHYARLSEAARHGPLSAIELSGVDKTYAWSPPPPPPDLERVTLLPEQDSHFVSPMEYVPQLESKLAAIAPAAVALPGWSDPASLAALRWCVKNSVPTILFSASTFSDTRRTWWREAAKRRIVSLCSSGLVGGRRHIDYLSNLGMPRNRIFPGYDVVDNSHFRIGAAHARAKAPEIRKHFGLPERYFLASGRFIAKKNLAYLISAYASYRSTTGSAPWDLVLVGDGKLKADLMNACSASGVTNYVHFPGFRQYDELPTYYGLAGAFVLPSSAEQWGLVVNEAMASGIPVLVSNACGCAPDLVHNGRNGFTFDPNDVTMLSRMMTDIASGHLDLTAMGEASEDIISAWSPAIFANNLWHAFDAAISAPKKLGSVIDSLILRYRIGQ